MIKTLYLGIDPGKSGALALVDECGEHVDTFRLAKTLHDVSDWLKTYRDRVLFACLEKVHSMPKQGVTSSFKFGESFGFCQGMLVGESIPYDLVTPQKWQKLMGCRTRGDKNVSKSRAQQLWPKIKIVHAIADALLIAEYARRIRV